MNSNVLYTNSDVVDEVSVYGFVKNVPSLSILHINVKIDRSV